MTENVWCTHQKLMKWTYVGHQSCGHYVCDGYKTAGIQHIYIIATGQGVPHALIYLNISVFSM